MVNQKRILQTYQKNSIGKQKSKKAAANEDYDGQKRRQTVLMSAYNCWQSLAKWREDARRNIEFVYGDQNLDTVFDQKTKRNVSERHYLRTEYGLNAGQFNIIRNAIRTAVGVYISNITLPVCIAQKEDAQYESEVLTATLHTNYRKNEIKKLVQHELETLAVLGMTASNRIFGTRNGSKDIFCDYVSPFSLFIDNTMTDPRYTDCGMVGYITDTTIGKILQVFAGGDKKRANYLRSLYANQEERVFQMIETFTDQSVEKDFFTPDMNSAQQCRVIHVWARETREGFWVQDYLHGTYDFYENGSEADFEAINALRAREQSAMGVLPDNMLLLDWEWANDEVWVYYALTPAGDVLTELVNPYWHGEPTILFEAHKFVEGRVFSFVKDLIDVQKEINQLFTTVKLLTRYSAKDLLFFPQEAISDKQSIEEIAEEYTSYNGMIIYKAKDGVPAPQHISTIQQAFSPLTATGTLFNAAERVSGIFGSLQGAAPTAGTPAMMYAQQTQNAATSLKSLFECFNSYLIRCAKQTVQMMQQCYDSERYIYDRNKNRSLKYDPQRVKDIDTEISIAENTDTPAYRLMVNDMLLQLKQYDTQNILDLRTIIDAGNFPFKEQLLDAINKREQEVQAGQ
ncbi:MAG: hypothetical protein LBN27_05160 [Prevotellaceae bacterium]|nr:hypothetical protein [Prevotellaceae bacterium]